MVDKRAFIGLARAEPRTLDDDRHTRCDDARVVGVARNRFAIFEVVETDVVSWLVISGSGPWL